MKKPIIISLFLFVIFTGCSTQNKMATSAMTTTRAQPIRAQQVGLSVEDIKILEQYSPKVLQKIERGSPITFSEVVKMNEAGIAADCIILIIDHTKSRFDLTTSDVIELQMEGVPYKVINYMIRTS